MSDQFKKGNMSHDASSIDELPEIDEPIGISSDDSLLRPTAPKGTSFNRRLVLSVITICGAVILYAFMYGFSPKEKPTSKPQEVIGMEEPDKEDMTEVTAVTEPVAEEVTPAPVNPNPNPSFFQQPNLPFQQVPQNGAINEWPYNQVAGYPDKFPMQQPIATATDVADNQLATAQQTETSAQKERKEVRKSAIRFGAGTASTAVAQEKAVDSQANSTSASQNKSEEQKLDDQAQKQQFLKQNHSTSFYSQSDLRPPISSYEVKAGTIIPSLLITGINSDLPGYVTAQVRENVYDTVTGKHLLIPQGARLIGTYDSRILYAQNRLLIVWSRMIYPNGYSIDLEGMPGIDGIGNAGLKDRVNYHTGRLAAGIILSSFMSAGARIAADKAVEHNTSGNERIIDLAGQGAAEAVTTTGNRIAEKNLNVQPTIQIRPGFTFNVFVYKDLVLAPYQHR